MRIFKRADDIEDFTKRAKQKNATIGFVPTMGALHSGHLGLLHESKQQCDISVCSIFVNPTQFNDTNDFKKYPRTTEKDIEVLAEAECDVLFLPEVQDIYPEKNVKHYDLETLETVFEGKFRPGHFQGVCQVVDRLFTIVQPDQVFFGQKDYQQCMVIHRLLKITPEFENIYMHIVPTFREKDGLAMSSRNMRLTDEQRKTAPVIYQTLQFLKYNIKPGNLSTLLQEAKGKLIDAGLKPDYISIANANTLEIVEHWDGYSPLVALIAAFLGEVRLIDNMLLAD